MTAAVLERPGSLFGSAPCAEGEAASAGRLSRGGVTLEERLSSVLHEARTYGSTECPVCHARMTSTRAGAPHGAEPAAECGGCGSRLS